jgi:hypothetical protein
MNCSQARKILYPAPAKSAATIETARAMEHVRECAQCRRYFESQTEWSRLLKEKVGTEPAPASLQERVSNLIEKNRASRSPGRGQAQRRRAIVATLIAAVALAAAWLIYRLPSQRLFQTIVEDHARYLNADSQVRSPDPAAIESWFRNKTDFGVRVPALESAELMGARLCFLKQRKAALVFYRKRGRTVSLFQFDSSGVSLLALDQAVIDGVPIWRTSFHGYSLAAFRHRGVIYVLVSDLRESELLELASAAELWYAAR